jgi:hypothetical protein
MGNCELIMQLILCTIIQIQNGLARATEIPISFVISL